MADYTTFANVEAILGADVPIDESSEPTLAQVNVWITLVSGAAAIALATGGGTLPITDANLLGRLDILCSREVAYQVKATRGAAGDDESATVYDRWHEEFEAALVSFADIEESAAAAASGNSEPSAYTPIYEPHLTREKIY